MHSKNADWSYSRLLQVAGQVFRGETPNDWPIAVCCLVSLYRDRDDIVVDALKKAFNGSAGQIDAAMEFLNALTKGQCPDPDIGEKAYRAIFKFDRTQILPCEGKVLGQLFDEAAFHASVREKSS